MVMVENCIPQPVWLNHFRKTFKERLALQLDLFSESVMRYEIDVDESVFSRYGNIATVGHKINAFRDTKL
jgi:hypothetical protein